MYDRNSARIDYYGNHNEQQYESYDDDLKGLQRKLSLMKMSMQKRKAKRKVFLASCLERLVTVSLD